jgi:MOSC domain-containing protein YiiM
VLEEGTINNRSDIILVEKQPKEISVLFTNMTLFHDQNNKKAIEKILKVDELADVWKEKLKRLL